MNVIPILSVVMPVYNGEKHLDDAIQSILNQSFRDFKFIIIDDCSTDNSVNMIRQYARNDDRILFVKKDKNIGIEGFIENLNIGIEHSNTKYIARMDHDDISHPTRFEKQIEFLEKNPDITVVGSHIDFINEKNEIIGEKLAKLNPKEIELNMTKSIQLYHPVIMFRNGAEIKYREKFHYCEDYDLYLNLLTKAKKLANIDDKLLKYRILNHSVSRNGKQFERKLMVEKSISFYFERLKNNGTDSYELFNNLDVLNILDEKYKNSVEDFLFAMDLSIKLNNQNALIKLIKKHKIQHKKESLALKYLVFSIVPIFVFRIFKKLL